MAPKTQNEEGLTNSQELDRHQCGEHRLLMMTLSKIELTVSEIKESLASGQAIFAKLQVRLDHLEKVVYTLAGAGLLSLLGAVVALVFKK